MGALLEMEVWSALMTLVCPVPKVQGGSAEITSSGCFRQILKKIWQSLCLLQMRCAVWNELIFSSNTPEDKTWNDRKKWYQACVMWVTCVMTIWDRYFSSIGSQLTTCTKAKANRYLRCRWAISSQSLLSRYKRMSAFVVCNNIPKICWGKLKKVASHSTTVILLVSLKSFFVFSW